MIRISSPISDAPWFLMASGALSEGNVAQVVAAIDTLGTSDRARPVLDLLHVEPVETGAILALGKLVERGLVNLMFKQARLAGTLPARMAAVLGESHVEAWEAVLAHIRNRREQGLADCPGIESLLARQGNTAVA